MIYFLGWDGAIFQFETRAEEKLGSSIKLYPCTTFWDSPLKPRVLLSLLGVVRHVLITVAAMITKVAL